MNCNPGQLVAEDLALAGVNARPHVQADAANTVSDCERTTNCAGGTIESCTETVACVIDLSPPIALQLAAHDPVVVLEQIAPPPISELLCSAGGLHDVGEQNRGQYAIRVWPVSYAGQEFLNLVEDRILAADPRQMVITWQLHVFRAGDLACHPATSADIDVPIAGPVQDQGGDADHAQQFANVDCRIHATKRDRCSRARTHAQVARPPVSEALVCVRSQRGDVAA